MTELERYRVLLVEDNDLDARVMTKALTTQARCEVERVADLASALEAVEQGSHDCVLLDLSLPDSEGLVSVETMVARSSHCPVVVLTGLANPEVALEAVHRGAQDYLVKGNASPELVLRSIRYAVARHSVETELLSVTDRLNTMHAREQIAQDLHDTVIQRLFASGMALQAATALPTRDEIADRALLAVDEIDNAIRELRQAIFGLHSLEEAESFAVEIGKLADTYTETLGFEPDVRIADVSAVPAAIRSDALAVLREALSNVARHANASAVSVTVSTTDDALFTLRVTDNGVVSAGEAEAPETGGDVSRGLSGNGLRNLRSRAEARQGTMRFDHGRNGGSELEWSVPLV